MATVGEVYHADTLLVAPDYIWNLISRIDLIATWAPDAVHCCVIENGAHPSVTGCIRRSLIRYLPYANTVVREVLEESKPGKNESVAVFRLLHTDAQATSPMVHQSLLDSLRITWRVQRVSHDPNKSFVSVLGEYTIRTVGDVDHKNDDLEAIADVTSFLNFWLAGVHGMLRDYVISVAYPMKEGKLQMEHRKQYERFEDAVVKIAALKGVPQDLSINIESLLQSWVHQAKQIDEREFLMAHLREEVAASRRIAAAASIAAQANAPPAPPSPSDPVEQIQKAVPANIPRAPPVENNATAEASEVLHKLGLKATDDPKHYPYAPPPVQFDPVVLQKIVVRGILDEEKAKKAFAQLDRNQNGFLTSDELAKVLLGVEHFGLFEDKNGTFSRIEKSRAVSQTPIKSLSAEKEEEAAVGSMTPRQKEARRREEAEAATARAMKAHAENWMSKYAKKQKGKLSFDEFCLLLIQLSL